MSHAHASAHVHVHVGCSSTHSGRGAQPWDQPKPRRAVLHARAVAARAAAPHGGASADARACGGLPLGPFFLNRGGCREGTTGGVLCAHRAWDPTRCVTRCSEPVLACLWAAAPPAACLPHE
eukprot:3944914-Prymnesium_polylepis.2